MQAAEETVGQVRLIASVNFFQLLIALLLYIRMHAQTLRKRNNATQAKMLERKAVLQYT